MTKAAIQIFRLEVTLLEDLHTGSGMGSAVVDRLLARAPDGTPIIAAEHVKGVWRDNALRLAALGQTSPEQIEALFGAANGKRGCLQAPELRPSVDTPVETLFWDATARKTGDRAPDDHSLRRSEYLPAGLELTGQGQLNSDDPALSRALDLIVKFTNALGSERTRGSGLITAELDWLQNSPTAGTATFAPPAQPAPDVSAGIRLLLQADTPLCIPTTGVPGNIIPSEHHIPGRTLFGAIAKACVASGTKPTDLFARKLGIGPAYPLPAMAHCEDAGSLADLQVLPMPLNLWTPKPGVRKQSVWPHWLPQSKTQQKNQEQIEDFRDMLVELSNKETDTSWRPDKTSFKRPRDNAYLYRQGNGQWQAFESRLGLRMRNRRGHPMHNDIKETEADLFTMEQIPTGTRFVADIRPLDPNDKTAVQHLVSLLGLDANAHPLTLRVGRGGAPVRVRGWCPLAANTPSQPPANAAHGQTLTLLTDFIARAPDLRFHTQLTAGALRDALGLGTGYALPDPDSTRGFSDNSPYRSFNAVSGLPASNRIAIRRGSVLKLEGAAANALAQVLAGRDAIGEHTWQGNGRFALDLDIDAGAITRLDQIVQSPRWSTDAERTDRVIRAAKSLLGDAQALKWLPSRAQLGNLRAWLADTPEGPNKADFKQRLEDYRTEIGNRRAGSEWREAFADKGLIEKLVAACCDGDACRIEDAELFLRVLTVHKSRQEDSDDTENNT